MRLMAEPDVGDLHRRRHAVHDHDLVGPVELVGFPRRERQGNVGVRRRARVLLVPAPRIAPNSVVAALVAERPQRLVNADQRQPLARRGFRVRRQQADRVRPSTAPSFGRGWTSRSYENAVSPDRRIRRTVLRERCRVRAISLIDFPLPRCSRRIRPIVSTTSIPHRPLRAKAGRRPNREIGGSILHADDAPQGVNFARRNTA